MEKICKQLPSQQLTKVIADSLRYCAEMLQKRKMQQQIKQASGLVAEQSLEMNQLLEASNADGL